jgi:two-component system, chemotaxis family, CheB/CheR fusion protein
MGFDEDRRVAEMNQRIRRVLWVFRTVATHMAGHSQNSDDYALHLSGRIAALGRVVLAPFFDGIDLESLIRDELQAAHPTQFMIRGPEARLAPKEAEMMSLAIHELATNAVKFGALSQSQAKIRIVWEITYYFGVRLLRFEWLEAGVEVAAACSAPGFGSELIERLIARELRGEGKMTFLPDGVHCTIEIPLSGPQGRHG